MNNRVDETAEVKTDEVAGEADDGRSGTDVIEESITHAQNPGENGEAADTSGAGERRAGGRPWRLVLVLVTLLAVTAGAAGYLYYDIQRRPKNQRGKT